MEIGSRRIVHLNVTTNPTLPWVKQQIREATSWDGEPRLPYGAPNASPHVERFMRPLRQEALNHFLFLSADHIRRVVNEYVRYYNAARPSQAIHGIPDPYRELQQPPPQTGRLVALPVLGGIQHDYRLVA